MPSIVEFGCNFRDDWKALANLRDKTQDEPTKAKIEAFTNSLALRALGVLAGIVATPFALSAVAMVASSPLTAVISAVFAAILIVAAHDLIIMGNNDRKVAIAMKLEASLRTVGAFWGVFKNVGATLETGIPPSLTGTWAAGWLYSEYQTYNQRGRQAG